jgi:hypothetical protein
MTTTLVIVFDTSTGCMRSDGQTTDRLRGIGTMSYTASL